MGGRFNTPAATDAQQPRMREIAAATMAMSGWTPDQATADTGANPAAVAQLRRRMGQPSLLAEGGTGGAGDDTKTKLGG
jgi:hypothetical protein